MRRDDPEATPPPSCPPLSAPATVVIEALTPLILPQRLSRIDEVVARRKRSVVPVLDGIDGPHNVAAVLRSAEAFGLQEVHLIEREQPFLAARRVTQGAELWLDLIRHGRAEPCLLGLRERGFRIYVATMDGDLAPDDLAAIERVAIVFGNEHSGVPEELTSLADGRYTIPMEGFAQSLNVSVAAAITLFAATRAREPDLSPEERVELRARYMLRSVPRADEVVAAHAQRRRP